METIDMPTWIRTVFMPRRKREIDLAARLFGYQLLGWVYIDHDYGIMKGPDDPYIKNNPEMVLNPVYVRECECQKMDQLYAKSISKGEGDKNKIIGGHYQDCLAEIPRFSDDPYAMLVLMEHLSQNNNMTLTRKNTEWYAQVVTPDRQMFGQFGKDAPTAVFEAAVSYLNHMESC